VCKGRAFKPSRRLLPAASAPQVGIMAAGLGAWLFAAAIYVLRLHRRPLRLLGRGALTLAVILYPTALEHAVSLVDCRDNVITPSAAAFLDGGGAASFGVTGASATTVVSVLSSDPFFVCWSPGSSQRPAGILACIALVAYIASLPCAVWFWLLREVALHGASTAIPRESTPLERAVLPPLEPTVNPLFASGRRKPTSDHVATLEARRREPSDSAAAAAATPLPVTLQVGDIAFHPQPACDPLLAPFLADYRPGAWYTKHLELGLLVVLAVIQALLARPVTLALVVTKALVVTVSTLGMAAFMLLWSPFPPLAAWKRPVRVGLLLLSAGCGIVNAGASALALGSHSPRLAAFVDGASYVLFRGICVVAVLLGAGFAWTLLDSARSERAAVGRHAASAPSPHADIAGRRSAASQRVLVAAHLPPLA
jgi:hypothetical protein